MKEKRTHDAWKARLIAVVKCLHNIEEPKPIWWDGFYTIICYGKSIRSGGEDDCETDAHKEWAEGASAAISLLKHC